MSTFVTIELSSVISFKDVMVVAVPRFEKSDSVSNLTCNWTVPSYKVESVLAKPVFTTNRLLVELIYPGTS